MNAITEWIRESALRSEVPSDSVGDGADDFEVVYKGASNDLVIISWVRTPSTEPTVRGIVENGCVYRVGTVPMSTISRPR